MSLALLNRVKKYYGDRVVLDIDKLEIFEGDRIGLVGENGAGKTTLIKALIGEIEVEEGSISLTNSYAYISQRDEVVDEILESREKSLFNAPDNYEDYLSGGEKVKLRVAKALSENKSLIIGDEPTSNLDRKSVETLEGMLKNHRGALLLVSHDRSFLDGLCNIIVEIEDGKIKIYSGNYSRFLEQKEFDRNRAEREYGEYISEKKRLQEAVYVKQGLRDGIRKTPKRMGNSEARLHKMGDQNAKKTLDNSIKGLKSRLEHLEEKEKPKSIKEIKIRVKEGLEITSKNVIEGKKVNVFGGDELILEGINFKIKNGKKVALIGDNGCGKSSLLREIISGENDNIRASNSAVIGYFDQSQQGLIEDLTILENVRRDCSFSESFVRINLDGFGFKGDSVFKRIESLSGGERVKVLLCKILLSDNNVLILDEPTNYLDIKSMEALENALINCDKTLVIVSHDRSFVSKICDYIIEINDGQTFEFNGGFEEYERVKNAPKIDKIKKLADEERMILQNRLSEVISLLSIEKDENKKSELEKRYDEILKMLK